MHLFRKYINNRGSALFMVISTMTAIMVSCMAMYFSVVSSRSTQYAVFNQQQSKSSAVSISDALLAGIMEGKTEMLPLLEQIQKLAVGETLTTDGNGFAAFSPSGTKEEDGNLGAYMVEITKIADNTFDIAVTSSVNGVNSIKHTIVEYSVEDGGNAPAAPTQIFAATGYVPNDVYIDGVGFHSDLFFDNELTITDAYKGITADVTGDLSVGGSLLNYETLRPIGDKSVTYAIRDTYTAYASTPVSFPKRSRILIGGNCILYNNASFANADIYILGDLYIFGNGFSCSDVNIFVDGNVYMPSNIGVQSYISANGEYKYIALGGTFEDFSTSQKVTKWLWSPEKGSYTEDVIEPLGGATPTKRWTADSVKSTTFMDPDSMLTELKERTASNNYYKWVIKDTFTEKKIVFSDDKNNIIPMVELEYSKDEKGCTITGVEYEAPDGLKYSDHAIVIDTGDDPNNVYTIRVTGLFDVDGDKTTGVDGKETFMWYPYDYFGGMSSAFRVSVLVKGRGSVVVDVPKGVVYQDVTMLRFMHYNWWTLCGGRIIEKNIEGHSYKEYNTESWTSNNTDLIKSYIHTDCNSSCSCSYSEVTNKDKCTIHTDKNTITVHCTIHDDIGTYCPECFPSLVGKGPDGKGIDHTGDCKFRVGRDEFKKAMAADESLEKLMNHDSKGELIYPNVNIYLVSCDESAEFRFSQFKGTNARVEQNMFFGYVYAPYMTYKCYGDGSGVGLRLVGGMTVSDYIFDDSYAIAACWPEKMPTDLMDSDSLQNQLTGLSNKTWKITPKRHG